MKIQLWFSKPTQVWRWTLTSDQDHRMMESGSSPELEVAMSDVATTVKWLLDQGNNEGIDRNSECIAGTHLQISQ